MPRYPDITVKLIGKDGNAWMIIGAVKAALVKANVPSPEITKYLDEAMCEDYNNLLVTTMAWVNVE